MYGLHSGYFHPVIRQWQSSISCSEEPGSIPTATLMLPLFIIDDPDKVELISSMPGVQRMGVNAMIKYLQPVVENGLKSVLLFAVTGLQKDPQGSLGADPRNPVVPAIKALRENYPDLLIACDVCLCGYTDHGHCGILKEDGYIDQKASVEALASISKSFVEAGAHIIAPSDMMDGRIKAIKEMLKEIDALNKVFVMSYSVKFASGFYGPFRDAAHSAPAFGDRKRYQLPVESRGLALRASDRDVAEGADMLMVKPGLAYLDLVREVKSRHPELPMAIYQVSGEYAMLYHGAKNGAFELEKVLMETLQCMRRAGSDVVISYFTPQVLDWMKNKGV